MAMNSIEKNARRSHGFMHNLIWKARETNQKWLWGIVLGISLIQLVWPVALVATSTWVIISFVESKFGNHAMALSFYYFVGFCILASPLIHAFLSVKEAFRNTSQFISIAGDMRRIADGSVRFTAKIFSKLMFALSGAVAMYCALAIWVVYKNKLKDLLDTELDVLGNALANSKLFWKQALTIYHLISARYTISLQKEVPNIQTAVSFALACKWMLGDPSQDKELLQWRKNMIAGVLNTYKDVLSPKVTLRLYEALGDKEK